MPHHEFVVPQPFLVFLFFYYEDRSRNSVRKSMQANESSAVESKILSFAGPFLLFRENTSFLGPR